MMMRIALLWYYGYIQKFLLFVIVLTLAVALYFKEEIKERIMDSNGNPILAVDAIIREKDSEEIILIKRKYEPHGWAIPGGIVDDGESCEDAVVREAKEETGLDVKIVRQFHVYSDPKRDPRKHVVSVVFICDAVGGKMEAASDAVDIARFNREEIGEVSGSLCFDHGMILNDYLAGLY